MTVDTLAFKEVILPGAVALTPGLSSCESAIASSVLLESSNSAVSTAAGMALPGLQQDHFRDLDDLGFLATDVRDRSGRPVVVVVARNVPVRVLEHDRLRRYTVSRLHAAVQQGAYSVVWMHSLATYRDNCPGLSWLWRTYEGLPQDFRTNLSRLYILHCDMSLWLTMAMLVPWFSSSLWRKVEWVSRVEFLYEHVDKRCLPVPPFVLEHDNELEEQPLADYGLTVHRESAAMIGLPAPM